MVVVAVCVYVYVCVSVSVWAGGCFNVKCERRGWAHFDHFVRM